MLSVETVGVGLVGYLLGSIPFGVLIAKKYGIDIFSVGSGNPGATNVLRSIGKPAGYLVFFLDFSKGLLATTWFLIPVFSFSGDLSLGLWGLPGAVLGHTYPIFSFPWRKRRSYSNGWFTRCYGRLFNYWVGYMGNNLFRNKVCCSGIHWFWN